jgi:hypothetical protein
MQFDLTLAAGQQAVHQAGGSYFSLLSLGASAGLTVQFYAGNNLLEELRSVTQRFKAHAAINFDRVVFKSSNAATISFVVSDGALDLEGQNV